MLVEPFAPEIPEAMTTAKTLLQLAGADLNPPRLADAALVLIDIQNEYLAGPLALPDAEPAIARAAALLARAREAGAAIIHIAHRGKAGSLFDRSADRGAIVAELSPARRRAGDREGAAQCICRHRSQGAP